MLKVTAEVPSQQPRLNVRDQADRDPLPQHPMLHLFFFALLVGDHQGFASVGIEQDRPAGHEIKITRAKLSPVNQRQGEPVRQDRSEFFHDIERQRRPSWPERVKKPDLRIESNTFQRGVAIGADQGVEKRENRVHGAG